MSVLLQSWPRAGQDLDPDTVPPAAQGLLEHSGGSKCPAYFCLQPLWRCP